MGWHYADEPASVGRHMRKIGSCPWGMSYSDFLKCATRREVQDFEKDTSSQKVEKRTLTHFGSLALADLISLSFRREPRSPISTGRRP